MINLGFNSGKDMPPVQLELTVVDRILEGISVLVLAATWVLSIVFYQDASDPSVKHFMLPLLATVITVLFLWASRAPIRFYNFPVKLNEHNYVWQYLLASRLVRGSNVIMNALMLFTFLYEMKVMSDLAIKITFIPLFLTFIGYYILAIRYR